MGVIGTASKSIVSLLAWLLVADIVGVIVGTILDVLPLRGVSPPLFYAVWLVLGILCGLFTYNLAGLWSSSGRWPTDPRSRPEDWTGLPNARRTGNVILVTCIAVLAALVLYFNRFWWGAGGGEYYVPDSASHSVVFFGSVLVGLIIARKMLMPEADGQRS